MQFMQENIVHIPNKEIMLEHSVFDLPQEQWELEKNISKNKTSSVFIIFCAFVSMSC